MTSRDPRAHVADVLVAADRIRLFVEGYDEAAYLADEKTQSAVERQFLIVGEALNRLKRDDAALASHVMALPQAVAFRNVLAHAYDIVDSRLVWSTLTVHLPMLRRAVADLLREMGEP